MGQGYHPEEFPGFLILLICACFIGSLVKIHLHYSEPKPVCTWHSAPTGWDTMKHWRVCND